MIARIALALYEWRMKNALRESVGTVADLADLWNLPPEYRRLWQVEDHKAGKGPQMKIVKTYILKRMWHSEDAIAAGDVV